MGFKHTMSYACGACVDDLIIVCTDLDAIKVVK